jgi:hypothetical protein
MSRLRLLTTSRSLVGLKESESHYRVTRERLLPHFAPVKNPFRTGDKAQCAVSAAETETPLPPAPTIPAARRARASAFSAAAAAMPAGLKLRVPCADDRTARSRARLPSWAIGMVHKWTEKLRDLFSRAAVQPAKPVLSSPTKLPVQGELSLDRIKVVRNDLSDADLEVVRLQAPAVRTGAPPTLQVVERPAQAGTTWGRFSGILRGAKDNS